MQNNTIKKCPIVSKCTQKDAKSAKVFKSTINYIKSDRKQYKGMRATKKYIRKHLITKKNNL